MHSCLNLSRGLISLAYRSLFLILTGATLTCSLAGCSQSNQYEVDDQAEYSDLESYFATLQNDETPNYGTLRLHSNGNDVSPQERTYFVEALVYNEDKTGGIRTAIDGGTVTISDYQLTSDQDDPHVPNRYFAGLSSANAGPLPGFGQTSTWALAGNPTMDIPPVNVQMYVPHEIDIVSPVLNDAVNPATIPSSGDLLISWNADPANTLGVLVHLSYDKEYFNSDASLPDNPVEFADLTEDDGAYSLSVAELQAFPTGATIFLTLMRGNFQEPVVDDKEFFMYAVSVDRGRFKLSE